MKFTAVFDHSTIIVNGLYPCEKFLVETEGKTHIGMLAVYR